MFYYIENNETSPFYNLALEQILFDMLNRRHSYCMLWRNCKSVIVGRYQNTSAEICLPFVESEHINVVRRRSGGGAVFHDLGNINFTFITDAESDGIDFSAFCKPVIEALHAMGVPAEFSGRNDIVIGGKKISGNAQYIIGGRVMHHGTLLYDTDIDMLENALKGDAAIQSKGIKSIRSRVANIRPHMHDDMPPENFLRALNDYLASSVPMQQYSLTEKETAAAKNLCGAVYSQWSWNFGSSPPCNIRKSRRIEGCGTVEILLDIAKEGKINSINFFGDFFGNEDTAHLAAMLKGRRYEKNEIAAILTEVDISRCIHNLDNEAFLELLLT